MSRSKQEALREAVRTAQIYFESAPIAPGFSKFDQMARYVEDRLGYPPDRIAMLQMLQMGRRVEKSPWVPLRRTPENRTFVPEPQGFVEVLLPTMNHVSSLEELQAAYKDGIRQFHFLEDNVAHNIQLSSLFVEPLVERATPGAVAFHEGSPCRCRSAAAQEEDCPQCAKGTCPQWSAIVLSFRTKSFGSDQVIVDTSFQVHPAPLWHVLPSSTPSSSRESS
ncbi:hypothetical protein PAPYR_6937 [Paratrimastix pyriformis]|uniref:Uncharacterized protein n=1 Tax=Paratrimastix pyriformis TaxID=342808 RepID=A0ABQ8UI40_9EUKA|nr:hypothetical protein PAPYR_6937 [Paratrimastix pyriformis]